MEEIEVKILDVDRKKCEKILLKLGAKKVFEGKMIALRFDDINNNLRNNHKTLRLRTEGKDNVLCVKELISEKGFKRMNEIETKISDFKNTLIILEKLGFKSSGKITKRRISYKLNSTKFEFDKHLNNYSFIPEFLEIESNNTKSIEKYAKVLGYKKEDMKPWGFRKVVKKYSKIKKTN